MPPSHGLRPRPSRPALAVDVYALRVNFVGALGWELHFPIEYAHNLFDALFEAGKDHGIGMVGMRAMESLRMEKSYRMWGSDMTPDYTPFEASLDRFVRMKKGAFIGREALETAAGGGRAEPLRHARGARRDRCRPARQRAAVRQERPHHRPRHVRLLRAPPAEEPRDRLCQGGVRAKSARRCRSRSWASEAGDRAARVALRSGQPRPEVVSPAASLGPRFRQTRAARHRRAPVR